MLHMLSGFELYPRWVPLKRHLFESGHLFDHLRYHVSTSHTPGAFQIGLYSCKLIVHVTFQDIGLNEHHQQNVVNYLRFARYGRAQRLRGVDASFEELKDSRYVVYLYNML